MSCNVAFLLKIGYPKSYDIIRGCFLFWLDKILPEWQKTFYIHQFAQAEWYSLWLISKTLRVRTVCVKSVKWPFNLILKRYDLFIVVVVHYLLLLSPPSVALHTSITCSRGSESFDPPLPLLLMDVMSGKTTEEIRFDPVFSGKNTRTNSWIWNQSKTGSVHGFQMLVTIWFWLKFSASVDVSEFWGIPSGQLTAGASVTQYLQGMRKWERCNRRHRTRRFQLFLTAFMK